MKTISYIFPIYNEAKNIPLLYETVSAVTQPLRDRYNLQFVFVNDGSRDESIDMLRGIQATDPSVVVVDFARNYGHQIAVTAGIDYADGDAIIIMDSDLQDPPRVSLELIEKWEEGFDVVYAVRASRKDSFFKRTTAHAFYWLLHTVADIDIPRNTGDFRLIDRRVAEELKRYTERNRFLRGMVSNIGFKQTGVLFDRDERNAGETGYPFKKMWSFALDGFFSFSSAPLKAISRLGYGMAVLSLLGALYAFTVRVFFPETVIEGWTFIVISVFLVGGIQLIMLGVLGGYIGRIYTEVQNRPLYSVQSVYASAGRRANG
ncbi:glycosyltransferase involved in cell wall biosynthesis [Microbacteriaceae bacterium SG_E_30_P1]|uniref:Glycosyltransferase involved in cell wall biosynthesis n=1 Tax=Antiquaquibacter oligotrophicus TaxID=2880260 RepID=A0ABT6KNZ7_9MICO|nr:glycosyltransferase family 2 protein [Antiquaquibacter oligotrophicus]MDH6181731.1 glycosyltransferase involved in cell wall biosynthesis [Antiquaquibacter oligotrophicus]UDF12586.1 glycosyltransferase family 2 protein [Antiquaquibacter oligotrophicus]